MVALIWHMELRVDLHKGLAPRNLGSKHPSMDPFLDLRMDLRFKTGLSLWSECVLELGLTIFGKKMVPLLCRFNVSFLSLDPNVNILE
jgi:hypothetical protein